MASLLLSLLFAQSAFQGWLGAYHPSNGTTPDGAGVWDTFAFGTVAIRNGVEDGGFSLQEDIKFHCHDKSVNSLLGMLLPPTEKGAINVPNDTSIWYPASHAGLVQGAARFSAISKVCPQLAGVIIDDFGKNYIGNLSSGCSECPAANPYLFGTRQGGFFCCKWKPMHGHCKPPAAPLSAPEPSVCCLTAGYSPEGTNCQGVPRCDTNPQDRPPCKDNGISLQTARDVKAALQGKTVDPHTGLVNHSTPSTTPHLHLIIVWYTTETAGFQDDGLLSEGIVDGVSLWIPGTEQLAQASSWTQKVTEFRAMTSKYNPDLLLFGGAYLIYSSMGWLTPEPFMSIFNQSVLLYDAGSLAGFFLFAGSQIPNMNNTLWSRWDLPHFFDSTLQPWLGSATLQVTSAAGSPLPGARVVVTYCAKAKTKCNVPVTRKLTDADGRITFGGWTGKNNVPHEHNVVVEMEGYQLNSFKWALRAQNSVHKVLTLVPDSHQRVDALDVSNSTLLLVDDLVIDSMTNLTRTMHRPAEIRAVITPDAPWEEGFAIGVVGTSVAHADGKVRVWYTLRNATLGCGHGDQPPCSNHLPLQPDFDAKPVVTAYAESTDGGLTFTKPILHQFSFRGSTANNIIGITEEIGTQAVFVDPSVPEGADNRYRAVSGFTHSASSNGKNWTVAPHHWDLPADPLNQGDWGSGGGDTQGVVFWDPPCQCWSFYTRFKNVAPRPPQYLRMVRRARSFSLDSNGSRAEWVNQSLVMRADDLDNNTHPCWNPNLPPVDFYGATPWYSDQGKTALSLYFMVVVRYWHWGPGQVHEPGGSKEGPGTYDLALTFSRDGKAFSFLGDRASWQRPTMDGTTGSRRLWLAPPGAVSVSDSEDLYFFTRGNAAEGVGVFLDPAATAWKSEIVMGRMRVNGLVSLDAPYSRWTDAAELRTRILIFQPPNAQLVLNVDASGGGSLTAELLHGVTGQPLLKSAPVVTNGVRVVVMWGGSSTSGGNATAPAQWAGQPVRLVMRLQACSLFSFAFVS